MPSPVVGDTIPPVQLLNQDSTPVNATESDGRFVVIYFYPKALTSGCTTQACGLRDNWNSLLERGIRVYGVSPDAPQLLRKFKDAENLPFDLLSDPDHAVANAFGTWQEKSMYGRKYMGMARQTFIANSDGKLISVMQKVNTSQHAKDVIAAIDGYIANIS